MIANYHTHTYRCGHAVGEDREYVEKAIERGLQVLGFSDHVPMPFPDGHESRFRVPLRLLDECPMGRGTTKWWKGLVYAKTG